MACGVRSVVCVSSVECGGVCGVWSVECSVWSEEFGVYSVQCGVRSVKCKVWV